MMDRNRPRKNSRMVVLVKSGAAAAAAIVLGVMITWAVAFDPNYFPTAALDDFTEKWYSRQLSALAEPSLLKAEPITIIYRFTWLRSFHNPVAIRVEIGNENRAFLHLKAANGNGGFHPGRLKIDKRHILTAREVAQVQSNLTFLEKCRKPPSKMGLDGAQWVFEFKMGNKYCVVDQWSPEEGQWRDAGMFLIGLAKYDTSGQWIY